MYECEKRARGLIGFHEIRLLIYRATRPMCEADGAPFLSTAAQSSRGGVFKHDMCERPRRESKHSLANGPEPRDRAKSSKVQPAVSSQQSAVQQGQADST
jgi:hypothetical protein